MQNDLSLYVTLFSFVRLMHTDLIIHFWKGSESLWEREIRSSFFKFFFFLSIFNFSVNKYPPEWKIKMPWKPSTGGRCPSFPTVIILHFIHIRALPQGTGMGNTDRACVVLLGTDREKLRLSHQSRLVFTLCTNIKQKITFVTFSWETFVCREKVASV